MRTAFFSISGLPLVLAALLGINGTAGAAPHPGTATSTLVSPQLGLYRSPLGFQLDSGQSGWRQAEVPTDRLIATIYRSPTKTGKGDPGALTVRVDRLARDMPLDKYVQRW